MRLAPVCICLVFLAATPAAAIPIPEWDANERCNTSFRGEGNLLGRGYCLAGEQRAYDALRFAWSGVDERTKVLCVNGASKAPSANYHLLLRCLEPFIGLKQLRNAPPFQR